MNFRMSPYHLLPTALYSRHPRSRQFLPWIHSALVHPLLAPHHDRLPPLPPRHHGLLLPRTCKINRVNSIAQGIKRIFAYGVWSSSSPWSSNSSRLFKMSCSSCDWRSSSTQPSRISAYLDSDSGVSTGINHQQQFENLYSTKSC